MVSGRTGGKGRERGSGLVLDGFVRAGLVACAGEGDDPHLARAGIAQGGCTLADGGARRDNVIEQSDGHAAQRWAAVGKGACNI